MGGRPDLGLLLAERAEMASLEQNLLRWAAAEEARLKEWVARGRALEESNGHRTKHS